MVYTIFGVRESISEVKIWTWPIIDPKKSNMLVVMRSNMVLEVHGVFDILHTLWLLLSTLMIISSLKRITKQEILGVNFMQGHLGHSWDWSSPIYSLISWYFGLSNFQDVYHRVAYDMYPGTCTIIWGQVFHRYLGSKCDIDPLKFWF